MRPPTVLAVDLSLTATGWVFIPSPWPIPHAMPSLSRGTIKTPARGKLNDYQWSLKRYRVFKGVMVSAIHQFRPDVIAIEVSTSVFGSRLRGGRYGAGAQYRAGQGLGHALGWIDGVLDSCAAYGYSPKDVVSISTSDAKVYVTGNRTADKNAVKAFLEERIPCKLMEWDDAQTDALAVGLTYLRDHGLVLETPIITGAKSTGARSTPSRTSRTRTSAATVSRAPQLLPITAGGQTKAVKRRRSSKARSTASKPAPHASKVSLAKRSPKPRSKLTVKAMPVA